MRRRGSKGAGKGGGKDASDPGECDAETKKLHALWKESEANKKLFNGTMHRSNTFVSRVTSGHKDYSWFSENKVYQVHQELQTAAIASFTDFGKEYMMGDQKTVKVMKSKLTPAARRPW